MGPELPVGHTELEKIAEIEISRYIDKLLYSEPYLLALKLHNSKAYLINLIEPSEPILEDSFDIIYTGKIAFAGNKIYMISHDSILMVYNLLIKPIEIDTFTYGVGYKQILFESGNIFMRKNNGFDVINGSSMKIVFSYTASDSSNTDYQRIFVDDEYLYFLPDSNSISIFMILNPDSLEFIKSYNRNLIAFGLISIRKFYALFLGLPPCFLFEFLEYYETEKYTLKHYPDVINWDSDFIFSATRISYTNTQIIISGPPYLQRKGALDEIEITGSIECLASSNDYFFCHSYNYQNAESKLLIYKIIKYDRPWEK